MAKAEEFISPANLWGRPLPGALNSSIKPATKKKEDAESTGMRDEDENEDIRETTAELDDVDVDAELEEHAEEAYAEDESADEDAYDVNDETEYAAEAGDEDDLVVAEDTSAEDAEEELVDNFEEEETVSARADTKKKGSDMASKKSGAEHIREEIARRQEAGESLRGVDIVAALAKKRVTVSPAQVSQLLKKAGETKPRGEKSASEPKSRVAARTKGPAEPQPRVAPKRPVASAPSKTTTLPMDQLKAASAFLLACDGCYDAASETLKAHRQLSEMMSH